MANLAQLKMLEDLNGFLLVDKPEGIAFSTVVKTVKRKFNLVKVGHGGSLDAMASGLLVLLINDANKFVDAVMGADRAYTGTMRLGVRSNTHDVHGVLEASASGAVEDVAALAPEKLAKALAEVRGDVFQVEPRFCAIRKEGSSAYEVADTGEHARHLAHVYRFAVSGRAFELVASKGILVRTLVNDFGAALGCGAALETVRRTRVGKFDIAEAVSFQKLLDTEIRDFVSLVQPMSRSF